MNSPEFGIFSWSPVNRTVSQRLLKSDIDYIFFEPTCYKEYNDTKFIGFVALSSTLGGETRMIFGG